MKSILKYCILTCVLGVMFSCSDAYQQGQNPAKGSASFADGIEISLAFPDMQAVATRAINDGADPELKDLDIFLFVFDGNSLKQTLHVPANQTEWADGDGYAVNNRIKFRAYLPQTDNDAIVHIVATNDADGSFARQIDAVGYGLEDIVMPKLAVSGNQDAYWQRIELNCPIKVTVDNSADDDIVDVEGTEERVSEKLKLVHLIRNFAKIKLELADNVTNFTVLSWTVVNDLDGGSVAPWYSPAGKSDISYPEFIKQNADNTDNTITPCSYDDLVAQGYPGVSYAGAKLRHTLSDIRANDKDAGDPENPDFNWNKFDSNASENAIFLYDRKVVSVNPLYILIYGSLQGNPGYYKVALAKRDVNTGLVSEYNVLRNIEYTLRITGVTAEGYPTPADAASGPAFNNISGDVTTRSMTQISDGVDMLFVNFVTSAITSEGQEVTFMYRFLENILVSGGAVRNDLVIWNAMTDPNNAGVGLKTTADDPKAVVTSIVESDTTDTRTGLKWKMLKLKFVAPTYEVKEQKFTIYTPPIPYSDGTQSSGLSRTINLVVRKPWDYERVRIYPGEHGDDSKFPDFTPGDTPSDTEGEIYVGPNKGDALTLFFELPAGIPESLFPLDFVIEADRQNIENAGAGNAAVQNGESLFKAEGVNDLRIQYVKSVLWSEYAPDGISSTPSSRIIRARFLTTTNMSSYPSNVDNITTTVRMYNPIFNTVDYKFTRKKGQPAS